MRNNLVHYSRSGGKRWALDRGSNGEDYKSTIEPVIEEARDR